MIKKQAQTSLEFMTLISFMLFALALFLLVMQESRQDLTNQRVNAELKEIALTIKTEVDLASQSLDGYSRNFTLPSLAYGRNYQVLINESIVFVQTDDGEHALSVALLDVQGQIIQFNNIIRKENGTVYLNS